MGRREDRQVGLQAGELDVIGGDKKHFPSF